MTLERNVHGLESHVRWVKQDARALRGIRRGWGTVNRKTFAHASHPSFLPSFLPGNDNTVTHIYLGDCNAQLIPRQCGHQPIRIVSASQSDRTSLQKIARVNSVGARTTWTHADLQSTLGTLELGLAGADACALRWGRRSCVKPSTVVAKQIGYLRVRGDFLLVRCTSRTYCASTGSRNDDTLTRIWKLITWG